MTKPRLLTVAVLAAVALIFSAAPVAATQGAHFFSSSSSVNDDGGLVVTWDEAGLGNATIDYTLDAAATAIYACINNGGKHPKASNKEEFDGPLPQVGGSFETDNGRVQGELTSGPLAAPEFTCPSGQTRVLAYVAYTDIVLTDTTNGVTEDVDDVDRCFFPNFPNLCP